MPTLHMRELLAALSKRRPIFHSEADFQHALAWEMHLSEQSASIRLEQPVASHGGLVHLDLLMKSGSRDVAVELKYKTRKTSINYDEEQFHLRNQSAQDIGRYDFLKDLARIERYVDTHPGAEGYAILLTNDPTYWQTSRKIDAVDVAFRIFEGRIITGDLEWGAGASTGTMRNRESPIQINASYKLTWQDYSHFDGQQFRYLAIHVANPPTDH